MFGREKHMKNKPGLKDSGASQLERSDVHFVRQPSPAFDARSFEIQILGFKV